MNRHRLLSTLLAFAVVGLGEGASKRDSPLPVEDKDYWMKEMAEDIRRTQARQPNVKRAKNVLLFLGDGMGLPAIVATRIYKGQLQGRPGEETVLRFEEFPSTGLVKNYCVDRQVADSACTASAIFTGVKSRYETLGIDVHTLHNDCGTSLENADRQPQSIVAWAQKVGKKTGLITTARVTHATPGALYAHTAHRDWECDGKKPENATACKDIALQLVEDEPGKLMNVILGGGRQLFQAVAEDQNDTCARKDGRALVEEWKAHKESIKRSYAYVTTKEEMVVDGNEKKDHVLGLFANSHMSYELDRKKDPKTTEPSIAEMTRFAIRNLKNRAGFFLMVEGARIDHALHDTMAKKSLEDVLAMEEAVDAAMEELGSELDETLVVVTADHSHVMTINGYPKRGNPILGISEISKIQNLPYTTLMFTNGGYWKYKVDPNNSSQVIWENVTEEVAAGDDYHQLQAVFRGDGDTETHGGEDIAVFARGPWSHLFVGLHEQPYIAHVMAHAACIGPYPHGEHCHGATSGSRFAAGGHHSGLVTLFLILASLVWRFNCI